jgi:hypothetical protein
MKDNRLSSFSWPLRGPDACPAGSGADLLPARSDTAGFHPNRSAAYAFAASSIKATTSSLVRTRSDT